jgi:hypothetical protein
MSPDRAEPKSQPSLWPRIGLLASSILVALLLIEGGVRLRQWVTYGTPTGSAFALAHDPVSGLSIPKPGQNTGRIKINRDGFRSPEISKQKPPRTVRLAFLGGSSTFCAEVSSNEATWPDLVTQGLRERYPDVRFEYLNAGVPGYGLGSMGKTIRHRVAPYRPDVIILYEAINEMNSDARVLAGRRGLFNEIAKDPSPLAKVSAAWYLLEKNITLRRRDYAAKRGAKLSYNADSLARGFEARYVECIQTAKTVAPLCAVATFSHKTRRDQSPEVALANSKWELYYDPYQTVDNLLTSLDAYNGAVRNAARSTGSILIDGESSIPGDDAHFADTVHFTDAGARAMAERVVRGLVTSPDFNLLLARYGGHLRVAG